MARMLITGCAGFIGQAASNEFRDDFEIIGVDDLSRAINRHYMPPEHVEFYQANVCDIDNLPLPRVDVVLHLAAQTAVTRSYASPLRDFRDNAESTFRLALWAQRHHVDTFIYASTNKVFGDLVGVTHPIDDFYPIDPKTPYGVSKAAGAMYVRELLPDNGFVFHQSCIAGEHQTGSADQGWVAFLIRSVRDGCPITCYGDGTQVRDLLHVDDLLEAYEAALCGRILPGSYVVGGGPQNAVSFAEVTNLIGGTIASYGEWRPHDQRCFISANEGLSSAGWYPRMDARKWLESQRSLMFERE